MEFWLRFEHQIRPTRFSINFLFITSKVEMKVRLRVKMFDFFQGEYSSVWREICRIVPNSVHIFTWNFRKIFFWNFVKKPRPSSSKICEISPYFLQFCSVLKNCVEKFTQLLSCVVCTLLRTHVHKQITKRRYRKEKPGHFVFGTPVLFTLTLGLKILQTFVIVCIEFWLRFEPQIRPTRFSINILFITAGLKGRFVCVWNCLIFFVGEYSFVWREICCVLTQILSQFLHGILGKNCFRTIFLKFCENQGYPLAKFVKFCPTFYNFILCWKIHTSTFMCCLHPSKEARPKTNHKKEI